MKDTELIEVSLNAIGKLIELPVQGLGWAHQNDTVTLLGVWGKYFEPPGIQSTVIKHLGDLIYGGQEAHVFPAAQIELNSDYSLALLPSNVPAADTRITTGLLLALPPGMMLKGEQWDAICGIAALTATALYGIHALEESKRRQIRLEAAAAVARDATILLDHNDLLNRVAQLISYQFGFYHTGIFLVDESGEYAVLRATNSEYGRQLIAHNHQLKIGEQGMVGYVTSTGEARIASDVERETIHYVNPLLPETRSEMTLPMHYGGQVIGALDVQSTEENVFTEDDSTTLQIMADQLANALVNARLHEEVWRRLEETRLLREIMVQASTLNPQEILQKTLELLQDALPFPYQAFFKRHGDTLIAIPGSNWPKQSLSFGDTPLHNVWEGWPQWRSASIEKLKWAGDNIRALSAVPLRANDKTQALFVIATPDPEQIQPRNQQFLETLATQLGVLLDNAQHYESTVHGQELLQDLIGTGEAMIGAREVSAVLDTLCQAILDKIYGTVEIALCKNKHLEWAKQQASPALEHPTFLAEAVDFHYITETDTMPKTYRLAQPGELASLKIAKTIPPDIAEHFASRYVLLQPLHTPERHIGLLIISLIPPSKNHLDDHITWIQALANQAALTLSNAQLISELKIQTHELGMACTEAQHLNEIRTQMLQNVSHELRTPLGIILGYTGILLEEITGPLTAQQLEVVEMINSRAQHLTRMVQNLMSLQGQIKLKNVAPIALEDLLQHAIQEFQEHAREQNVQFYIENTPDMPLIPGDQEQLHLAFSHLVENAIKFSPRGGNVLIRIWAEEHWAIVTIKDQGVGIATEHLDHIFDRFYQIDGSTTRQFEGMGIGLALVWDIVEAHQGQIQVQSSEGKGSTFLVALPLELDFKEEVMIEDKLIV